MISCKYGCQKRLYFLSTRCCQKFPILFLFLTNGELHSNVHGAGASEYFRVYKYEVTLLYQHQRLSNMDFSDQWHLKLRFTPTS